ncbi:CopY/TcrY family copper transport repressor [Vagococcus vulneris]|uniref:Penicillinase repressor n=1 Tax=Vagococcus vulneris TaxID=1977869 RepID=A0A429ZX24_9ENTE|nr:CopY/TcrY family copper transport repressor [Vagococcus vulneris]RST98404.1 hypothetical protein CBF37_07780 [Vagococcus vulneris]
MENVSNSEWEIMRVVWTKSETTSSEIIDILGDRLDWQPSTVKTLLARLVDKGLLVTKRDGKRFKYSASASEDDIFNTELRMLMSKICNTKVHSVMTTLIDEYDLSQSDIDSLIKKLNDKRKNAPEKITCHCIPGQCKC